MTDKRTVRAGDRRQWAAILHRYLPFTDWLLRYRSEHLIGDLLAGTIVAIMLVPQSMAYALLAGLPPQVGLYASILPLVLYALLGTSRSLAVGPVAIVSLLVASGLSELSITNASEYVALAALLALMVGVIQCAMGVVRFGFLVNFLSHPVISGFTSAAALVIGFSQLKHLLGIEIPRSDSFVELLRMVFGRFPETNLFTLAIGLGSIAILVFFNQGLGHQLAKRRIRPETIASLTKSGPLAVVLVSSFLVVILGLSEWAGVKTVGAIPRGLPSVSFPFWEWQTTRALLPTATAISFVGYMESIAVAKSLASKRRQRIDTNQELIGLGVANLGSAITGGYPVTGGLSRSVVNFSAGANTGLASIITALWVMLTVVFLTPLLVYLPQASLAAIIFVAVSHLFDLKTFFNAWAYCKQDAVALIVTFLGVLVLGIERGLIFGVLSAIVLYLWRTSQPHMAVVGRVGNSEHFRNVLRHSVKTEPHILALRIDESLYFANTKHLEERLLFLASAQPDINSILLVCSGINFIDSSALDTLTRLTEDFHEAGMKVYMAEVKGPVSDCLVRVGFSKKIDGTFLSTHEAMLALSSELANTPSENQY